MQECGLWSVLILLVDKKKFGGHNRLKQCCIYRRCNTCNTSLRENKQPPPHNHAGIHETMKEFCGTFGWCLFTNYYMQVFNTSLPPLEHSVSLLGCQTPAKSKEVLKASDTLQWHSYIRTHAGLRPADTQVKQYSKSVIQGHKSLPKTKVFASSLDAFATLFASITVCFKEHQSVDEFVESAPSRRTSTKVYFQVSVWFCGGMITLIPHRYAATSLQEMHFVLLLVSKHLMRLLCLGVMSSPCISSMERGLVSLFNEVLMPNHQVVSPSLVLYNPLPRQHNYRNVAHISPTVMLPR